MPYVQFYTTDQGRRTHHRPEAVSGSTLREIFGFRCPQERRAQIGGAQRLRSIVSPTLSALSCVG